MPDKDHLKSFLSFAKQSFLDTGSVKVRFYVLRLYRFLTTETGTTEENSNGKARKKAEK